ncbi:MAG: indolepyruvate oxidoreductase subunit beta [Planctomycetota bacterium]|jgi:indolepyruvate ferredoxin oxidoreductase beta subunit
MNGALRILLVGVGGQGVLSAARLLGEAAMAEGLGVLVGQLHGMAQRGGSVESTVVIGNATTATIADNEADALIAFEPLEALRAVYRLKKDGLIILNTTPITPFSMTAKGENYPEINDVMSALTRQTEKIASLDAYNMAVAAGNAKAVNCVMLGALSWLNILPFKPDVLAETISRLVPVHTKSVNAAAFLAGQAAVSNEVNA